VKATPILSINTSTDGWAIVPAMKTETNGPRGNGSRAYILRLARQAIRRLLVDRCVREPFSGGPDAAPEGRRVLRSRRDGRPRDAASPSPLNGERISRSQVRALNPRTGARLCRRPAAAPAASAATGFQHSRAPVHGEGRG
jgi:hypothetical protein